jgi:hypothetical protein
MLSVIKLNVVSPEQNCVLYSYQFAYWSAKCHTALGQYHKPTYKLLIVIVEVGMRYHQCDKDILI